MAAAKKKPAAPAPVPAAKRGEKKIVTMTGVQSEKIGKLLRLLASGERTVPLSMLTRRDAEVAAKRFV